MSEPSQKLLNLLTSVLKGSYKKLNNGEYSFKSPFKEHRKKKLQIQLDPDSKKFGYWNCWITENSGKSLFSLFKKVSVSKEKFDRLGAIIDTPKYYSGFSSNSDEEQEFEVVSLPQEFNPLWRKEKHQSLNML